VGCPLGLQHHTPTRLPACLQEFYHPERGNAASVPFIVLMMYAAIAHGECSGCNTLAAVLFWAGAAPTLALGLLRVGDNISMLR